MNARNTVWVERSPEGEVIRIFRSTHGEDWKRAMESGLLFTCPKRDAVSEIWESLWTRAAGRCEYCSRPITRTGWTKGEMHEEIPRGNGGEVSLTNSKMICRTCHRTSEKAHGNRVPQWSKPFDLEE